MMQIKEIIDGVIEKNPWFRMRVLAGEPTSSKHVLVIPAYRETPEEVAAMIDSIRDDGVLLVLVINDNHLSKIEGFHENVALFEAMAQHERIASGKMVVAHGMVHALAGVGGVRFIGSSIARGLQQAGLVESQWVHASDSDSRFPEGYFEHTHGLWRSDSAMALHSLGHYGDDEPSLQAASTINCMLSLTALSVQEAGSPYAITPTGIGVAISAKAHDAVGGWPLMSMAEDLWLIKRAAKYGRVHRVYDPQVLTSSRAQSKAVARPGQDEETAGHGDMISGIVSTRAAGNPVVATPAKVWRGFRAIYEVINMVLDGKLAVDCDLEKEFCCAAERYEVEPEAVTATVVDTVPLVMLRAKPTRQQFYFTFDMGAQGDVAERLCMEFGRDPVEKCVDESPWGIKHEGDWKQTEQRLRQLLVQKCVGDAGNYEE